jgi:acyl transferase domain-containing protein
MEKLKDLIFEKFADKSIPKEVATELLLEIKKQEAAQYRTNEVCDIAVVGMACRMPGAKSPEELWEHLINCKDFIGKFPEERKRDILEFSPGLAQELSEYKLFDGAFMERIDLFDAEFFNIPPAEARVMDPLQRLFLETTSEALERAGYPKNFIDGSKVGIYVGHAEAEYVNLLKGDEPSAVPGNLPSIIASRISYLLNLKGPTMLVDTTCSSSLVALHLACEGLRNGDCDVAVVGGVRIIYFPAKKGASSDSVGIMAPDCRTKAFDAQANGTGVGEGVVSMVFKPLDAAIRDKDNILAVIKGSAVNSDGRSNGITAPNASAQTDVILEAWRRAEINPEDISYIEAHGTGTKLGDPIEFEGLKKAFHIHTDKKQFCGIGSLKSNLGHLDTAAGIAGLMKVILAMNHNKNPASINYKQANPLIDFENSALYMVDESKDWLPSSKPRIAGVSSFGLSGTNCHVVVSEYIEEQKKEEAQDMEYLITYSAKTFDDLKSVISLNLDFIGKCRLHIRDISFTLNVRREHYPFRIAAIAGNREELVEALMAFDKIGSPDGIGKNKLIPVSISEL